MCIGNASVYIPSDMNSAMVQLPSLHGSVTQTDWNPSTNSTKCNNVVSQKYWSPKPTISRRTCPPFAPNYDLMLTCDMIVSSRSWTSVTLRASKPWSSFRPALAFARHYEAKYFLPKLTQQDHWGSHSVSSFLHFYPQLRDIGTLHAEDLLRDSLSVSSFITW